MSLFPRRETCGEACHPGTAVRGCMPVEPLRAVSGQCLCRRAFRLESGGCPGSRVRALVGDEVTWRKHNSHVRRHDHPWQLTHENDRGLLIPMGIEDDVDHAYFPWQVAMRSQRSIGYNS